MRIKKLDLNLFEQEQSRELRAKRRVLSMVVEGSWSALLKGRGMEFAGYRQYTPSDDASRIDWGASLRSHSILVREFEEFRSVNVLFLLDVSDTMLLTSQKKLKVEYGAELMFDIAVSILNNGDSVGYALFTDEIVADELPNVGRIVTNRLANTLSKPELYGGKKNLRNVTNAVNARLKERALIIMVSDFVGFEPGWDRYIRLLGQKFDLIGIRMRDPMDVRLPEKSTQLLLQDPFSGEQIFVDSKAAAEQFTQQIVAEERFIKKVFEKAKAGLITINTDTEDKLLPIIEFFRKRAALERG